MNFKELVEGHPEIMRDRHALSFSEQRGPAEIAAAFARSGVVMLKGALAPETLATCAEAFRRFVRHSSEAKDGLARAGHRLQTGDDETSAGSWHSPWAVRDHDRFPAAVIISALLKSWTWDVVEEICGSSHLAIVLKFCTARHGIDRPLGIGAHQDAKVVAPDLPLSIWIPALASSYRTPAACCRRCRITTSVRNMSWRIPRGCGFRLTPPATSPFTPSSRLTSRQATEHSPTASASKSAPRRAAPSPRGTKIRPFAYRDETASRPSSKREVQPAAPLESFSIVRNSAAQLPRTCAKSVSEPGVKPSRRRFGAGQSERQFPIYCIFQRKMAGQRQPPKII